MPTDGSFRQPSPADRWTRQLHRPQRGVTRTTSPDGRRRRRGDFSRARSSPAGPSACCLRTRRSGTDSSRLAGKARSPRAVRPRPMCPDGLTDLLNDAMAPLWRAIPNAHGRLRLPSRPPKRSTRSSRRLPDASVEAVIAEGRERLVDRSHHRTEHLDAIEPSADGRRAGSSTGRIGPPEPRLPLS